MHSRADNHPKSSGAAVILATWSRNGRQKREYRHGIWPRAVSRTVSCRRPPGGDWFSLVDGCGLPTVCQCSVNTVCIVVNGIDSDLGFAGFKTDVAVVSEIMEERTRWRTVVGDHSKLSTVATN